MKSYTTKSNALRAAKSAGFTKDQVEIVTLGDGFAFIEIIEAPTFEQAVQTLHDQATTAEVVQNADQEFEAVTEKQHQEHRGEIVHKSDAERPCKLVWAIADQMPGAKRKDVIAAAVAKGVAFNTARTQYQTWFSLNK